MILDFPMQAIMRDGEVYLNVKELIHALRCQAEVWRKAGGEYPADLISAIAQDLEDAL